MLSFPAESSSAWPKDLAAAKEGDREALGRLLQLYWAPLWEQAAMQVEGSLRSKQAASDVVQETLLEAHLHIADFRGTTPLEFQAWLRAMLANNIRDAWRRYTGTQKRQTSLEVPLDPAGAQVDPRHAPSRSMLDAFLLQEQAESIQKMLERLPEHYRTVIRLRHWESMTFSAIGEAMGTPPDAARQLWYRAVEMFADLLEQDDAL